MSAWKKNNSLPPVDKISKISDYLGMSLDFLLNGEDKNPIMLTVDEKELIENYNKLTNENKKEVSKRVAELVNGTSLKTNNNNDPTVSYSHVGAVAGSMSGTFTITNGLTPSESKKENNNISGQYEISETSKEMLEIFEGLPMRERVKLLSMVYEYEENYRKSKE